MSGTCPKCEVDIHGEDNKKVHPDGPHKKFCPETWPDWLKDHFDDIDKWEQATQRRALSSRVLAVANTRIEGAWSAYIDAVPGLDHKEEMEEVLRHGNKMPEPLARFIFPIFKELAYVE